MKKILLIALTMLVTIGAMAYTDPPDVKKVSMEFTIDQDQSVNVVYDLEKASFDFSITAEDNFIIETGYIEVMPVEVYQERWQPGNYSYGLIHRSTMPLTYDKTITSTVNHIYHPKLC